MKSLNHHLGDTEPDMNLASLEGGPWRGLQPHRRGRLGREQLELPGEGGSESLDDARDALATWRPGGYLWFKDKNYTNTWEFNGFLYD